MRRFSLALLLACSSPSGTISITTGGEQGALTRTPAVVTVTLDAVDQTGAHTTLVTATLPDAQIDLGDQSQTLVASLQLAGKDGANNDILFGATPLVELGALDGATLPLFVQRRGELARMPGSTEDARSMPLLAATNRGIYWVGGSLSSTSDPLDLGGYDLLALDAFTANCAVNVHAKSFALVELTSESSNGDFAYVGLVGDDGFLAVGLPSCGGGADTPMTTVPTDLNIPSWSSVEGAATVMGDDGTAFIVGPSNPDAASASILVLSPTATTVTAINAPVALQGAAVAWAPGRGIFLYGGGGGATTVSSAGAQSKYGYADDPTQGGAAVAFDKTSTMLVLEGDQLSTLDLTRNCPNDSCTPTAWGVPFPVTLENASLFAMGTTGKEVFVAVGEDASGATHLVRADATTSVDVPLKIPRQHARAVKTTTGAVVIVGGGSATPESYVD